MKRTVTAAVVLGLLMLALAVGGCERSRTPDSPWAGTGGTTESVICTDEAVLAQLKNDETPEFVLDGSYYTLPAELGAFTENGWTYTIDGYEGQGVVLQPGERVDLTLTKDGNEVEAVIANDGSEPLEVGDASTVILISLYARDGLVPPSLLVTKYGITTLTSTEQVRELLRKKDGFKEDDGTIYLTFETDDGLRDILYFREWDDAALIEIASEDEYHYRRYKPPEQKAEEQAENVAEYKADAEQGCPADYSQIVELLGTKATVPFCSREGTVLYQGTGNYEGTENDLLRGADLSLYVVRDASGQTYCIYGGYAAAEGGAINLPELAEGDVISLWGFALEVTELEGGVEVPTVIAKIIEKDGELIYLADELQVN